MSFSCRFRDLLVFGFFITFAMLTIKKIWRVDGEEDVGRWKLMECWKEGRDLLKKGSYVLKNQFESCVCQFFYVPLRRVLCNVLYEVLFSS